MLVKLQKAHRQAMRVGIVLGMVFSTFLEELSGPWAERQPFFEPRANIEERGKRRLAGRRRWLLRSETQRSILPDAGQVRFSVGHPRCWCGEIRLAVSRLRYIRGRE